MASEEQIEDRLSSHKKQLDQLFANKEALTLVAIKQLDFG